MSCPTCGHTAEGIGHGMFHCPRCGTLLNCPTDGAVHVPALVNRVRRFRDEADNGRGLMLPSDKLLWHTLGIGESIDLPEARQP